ncbi:MAG: serine hydrolase [Candidatus Paceibacterota bacterium]
MRLKTLLITIILGAIAGTAVFFLFVKTDTESASNIFPGELAIPVSTPIPQAFILPISETNYLPIRNFNIIEPAVNAKAAALFDVNSGRFLYSKNVKQQLPIASLTKLMSAIVILENLDLNDIYTVSVENLNVDGQGAQLYKDEQLRGIDLLKIMLIKSSNDAALVFASEARNKGIDFVAEMNAKALELGMTSTRFSDPAGLDDNGAFSTAFDLVKLIHHASGHDLIAEILTTKTATVASVDGKISHYLTNTNVLLGQIPGIIIGKTGYTDGASGTMALEVGINGGRDRLISVVLGSDDASARFVETVKIIEWAKSAYRWR